MHGTIINLSSKTPFTFTFNPETVKTKKEVSFFIAPNIGGASKEAYFSGFDNREVSLEIQLIDKQSELGVTPAVEFFQRLGEPDPGLLGTIGSLFGNENYPPPKVLYQFGISLVPLVYDVATSPDITLTHFKSGEIAGSIGVPTMATVGLTLRLDENNILNKANKIAKEVNAITGAAQSVIKEAASIAAGTRIEAPFG